MSLCLRASFVAATLGVLVAVALPASAYADDAPGHVDLAVEAPAEGEPLPGPDPRLEDSPFGPREYEVPWTYGMGVALAAVGVLATLGVALGYWLLVARPTEESEETASH